MTKKMINLRHYSIGVGLYFKSQYEVLRKNLRRKKNDFNKNIKEKEYDKKLYHSAVMVIFIAQVLSAVDYISNRVKRKRIR